MALSNSIPIPDIKSSCFVSMNRNKQRGVVLVVSLIFLIALTAVASALMLNTTTDMKMSGASEMQMVANQEVFGAMDELIYRQMTGRSDQNEFKLPIVLYKDGVTRNVLGDLLSTNTDITSATIGASNNKYNIDIGCPRAEKGKGDSADIVDCSFFQVQVNKRYGRNNSSTVQVNAGIVQKLSKKR